MRSCALASRVPLVLSLAAAGCVLPERDNPLDDAKAPAAVLRIGDATLVDGSCPALPLAEQPLEVVRASRGRCLVLDASATTDPQGDPITFAYRLISPREEPISGTGPMVEIPESLRRAVGLTDVDLVFEVRATDGTYRSRAEANVVLTNSPPTVDVGSPRTLPVGGFPWSWDSASTDFTIPFRALRATDPDGDPVEVCWTLPGEEEDCSDPEPELVVPSGAARTILAKARATDGILWSPTVPALVAIQAPNVWTHVEDPFEHPEPMERMDSRRRTSGALGFFDGDLEGVHLYDDLAVLQMFSPDELLVLDARLDAIVDSTSDPGAAYAVGVSEGGDRLWSIRRCDAGEPACANFGTGEDRRYARTWTMPGFGDEREFDVTNVPYGIADRDIVLSVTGDGAAWISLQLNEVIEYVTPDGARTTLLAPGDRVFSSHDSRPGTDEVWAVEIPNGGGSGGARFVVLSQGEVVETIEAGVPILYKLEWVDAGRFWTYEPGVGLRLVEAELLRSGTSLDDASIVAPRTFGPTLHGGPELMPNPLTGECIASGVGAASVVLARQDGSIEEIPADSLHLMLVDPTGQIWFQSAEGVLTIGDSPSQRGVARTVEASSFLPRYDRSTGGLWVPSLIPGALLQVGEDGRILRYVTQISVDGAPAELLEDPILFALDADGGHAWALTLTIGVSGFRGLLRVDLSATGEVLPATLVLGSSSSAALDGSLEGSAPVSGAAPFLWASRDLGGEVVVVRIEEDGSGMDDPVFTVPAGEDDLSFALLPRDNSLCVGTRVTAGNEIQLRRLSPDGAIGDLGTVVMGTAGFVGVTASTTPAEDLCWAVYGATAAAFDATTGAPVRTFIAPIRIESLLAESRDEIWYSARDFDGVEHRRKARLQWNGSGWDEAEYGGDFHALFVPRSGQWFDF